MIIPSAQFIYGAIAAAERREQDFLLKEVQELRAAGAESVSLSCVPADSTPFEKGYLIGLETARTLLAMMPSAVMNDVSI